MSAENPVRAWWQDGEVGILLGLNANRRTLAARKGMGRGPAEAGTAAQLFWSYATRRRLSGHSATILPARDIGVPVSCQATGLKRTDRTD